MPDLCLETFGLAEKGISLHIQIVGSLHPSYLFLGPEWDGQCVKDHRSRILPVKFGKTDSNSPDYCINKCKSHEYSYAGVEYSKVIILKTKTSQSSDSQRSATAATLHQQRRILQRRATATGSVRATLPRSAEAAGR